MTPLTLSKLILAVPDGWDDLRRKPEDPLRLFLAYVLPLALLPPAMLLLAASQAESVLPGLAQRPLGAIAAIMFFAELATIPLMAAVIRIVAEMAGVPAGWREALIVAALAPTPLWLASGSVATADPALAAAALLVAAAASANLVYRGLLHLLRVQDEVRAFMMAINVYAPGVMLWVLLLAVFLLI